MPMFKKRFKNSNSKLVSDNSITLPSPPQMSDLDIKKVYSNIMKFLINF